MSGILIMNANGAIDHGDGSPISDGVFTITSAPSTKSKAEGAGVYTNPLQYTFAGGSATGFIDGSVLTVVPQQIPATALKPKSEGALLMRLGDTGIMNAIGTIDPPPPTAPFVAPVVGPVEVTDAGQTKARGV